MASIEKLARRTKAKTPYILVEDLELSYTDAKSFAAFMRGQACPVVPEGDAVYPWDYARWLNGPDDGCQWEPMTESGEATY